MKEFLQIIKAKPSLEISTPSAPRRGIQEPNVNDHLSGSSAKNMPLWRGFLVNPVLLSFWHYLPPLRNNLIYMAEVLEHK